MSAEGAGALLVTFCGLAAVRELEAQNCQATANV